MPLRTLIGTLGLIAASTTLASPAITLMSNSHGTRHLALNDITDIVKQAIDTSDNSPYSEIKIQPIYSKHGVTDHLLVYLPSKHNYSFTITRINLNQTQNNRFTAGTITTNYNLSDLDWQQQPHATTHASCPDDSVEFVSATSYPYIDTAKTFIEQVHDKAVKRGYKSIKLEGDEASVSNYENYLACPKLKGFYNIGHGGSNGILLSDGMLSSSQFQQMHKELHKRAIVVLNSCEVFNDPLKSAVINGSDAQKYAGGITTLSIGASEPASACFWQHAFNGSRLTSWLNTCAKQIDPNDTWGIGGNGKEHMNKPA